MKFSKKYFAITICLALILFVVPDLFAQCPMCRSAAESNLKAGGESGRGLNAGILYMLAMPYLLVTTLGLLWWRSRRRQQDQQSDRVEGAF